VVTLPFFAPVGRSRSACAIHWRSSVCLHQYWTSPYRGTSFAKSMIGLDLFDYILNYRLSWLPVPFSVIWILMPIIASPPALYFAASPGIRGCLLLFLGLIRQHQYLGSLARPTVAVFFAVTGDHSTIGYNYVHAVLFGSQYRPYGSALISLS